MTHLPFSIIFLACVNGPDKNIVLQQQRTDFSLPYADAAATEAVSTTLCMGCCTQCSWCCNPVGHDMRQSAGAHLAIAKILANVKSTANLVGMTTNSDEMNPASQGMVICAGLQHTTPPPLRPMPLSTTCHVRQVCDVPKNTAHPRQMRKPYTLYACAE